MNLLLQLRHVIIITIITLLPFYVRADKTKNALKLVQKGEYEKAISLLDQSLLENTINPGANFVYAMILSDTAYRSHDLAKAYYHINLSLEQKPALNEDEKKDFEKLDISDPMISALQAAIASKAYLNAIEEMSIDAFKTYISIYQEAMEIPLAVEKRDSLVFDSVSVINTWQAYRYFTLTYEDAKYFSEAKRRYFQLHYQDYFDQSPTLETYLNYLKEFPDSHLAEKAIQAVFSYTCMSGKPEDYLNFIYKYPESTTARYVGHRLSLLDLAFYEGMFQDTINQVLKLPYKERYQKTVFPYYSQQENAYSFVSTDGTYTSDFLIENAKPLPNVITNTSILGSNVKGKLVVKRLLGDTVWMGKVRSANILQGGFFSVQNSTGSLILSALGDTVLNKKFDQAAIIDHRFFLLASKKKVGLYSLTGVEILPISNTDIEKINDHWMVYDGDLFYLLTEQELLSASSEELIRKKEKYEEVELLPSGQYFIYKGDQEGLLSSDLQEIVPLGIHALTPFPTGVIVRKKEQAYINYFDGQRSPDYDDVRIYGNRWTVFKRDKFLIRDIKHPENVFLAYDSVKALSESFLHLTKANQDFILCMSNGQIISVDDDVKISAIRDLKTEARNFLLLETKKDNYLYSNLGKRLIKTSYPSPISIDTLLFVVENDGKLGIIDANEEIVLPFDYDGCEYLNANLILVAKEGNLHLFSLINHTILPLILDSKPYPLTDNLLNVNIEGQSGIISDIGEMLTHLRFKKIMPWNKEKVLVSDSSGWSLFDLDQQKKIVQGILSYAHIKDSPDHKITAFYTSSGVGLLDNRRGLIVPPSYDDIKNIGTDLNPLFLAYQEENGKYKLDWISVNGDRIVSQVYNEKTFNRLITP